MDAYQQPSVSTTSYPHGPDWSTVKPFLRASHATAKATHPSDLPTARRLQFAQPPSAIAAGALTYSCKYPPQAGPHHGPINFKVTFCHERIDPPTTCRLPVILWWRGLKSYLCGEFLWSSTSILFHHWLMHVKPRGCCTAAPAASIDPSVILFQNMCIGWQEKAIEGLTADLPGSDQ
jgi:hypothetical protein